MKKIFALVLTFIMIFSISVSAASGLVPANLQYNNIKINLNGSNVATSAEPFIIDGTTYLPVRALAEALGLAVEWDATTNTVKLSNISIIELIALEKACALLCKRFETIARLDSTNNAKFKEYQMYYEKIFSELESRVNIICNAV